MSIALDESKYADVPPELKDRFFAFASGVELRSVSAGGYLREYLDVGPRGGKPLVFFTGGIKFPLFSFAVIEALSGVCRVIAPVQPRCRRMSEYFEGLEAILDRESIGDFSVAGSSWGGQIAQAAMIMFPKRIPEAILASTGMSAGFLRTALVRMHRRSLGKKDPKAVLDGFKKMAMKLLCDSPESAAF